MRPLPKAILAGAAAIALVGVAGWAAAQIENAHVLDVRLPDGSLAHIRYVGDTPPTVSFVPPPTALSILAPASDPIGRESPFAAMDRISQAMEARADAMFREIAAPPIRPLLGSGLVQVDVGALPPGAQGFSMVSTMTGKGVCTRSVEYRSLGGGKPPYVVTHVSGPCGTEEQRPAISVTSGATPETPRTEHADRQAI